MPTSSSADRELAPPPLGLRVLLVGLAAIGPFSLNIFKPCLPWIKADFGDPITTVQLALSLSILAAAVATMAAGPLADALGRKPVALACVYLYVLSCLLGTVAPNVEVVIAARIVQAASSSVAMVIARAIIHDRGQRVQRTIARVTILAVVTVLLAPALGGLLIDHIGWRAVFGLTTVVGVLLLWPVHRSLSETVRPLQSTSPPPAGRATKPADGSFGARVLRLVTSPIFLGYAMQSSLHFAVFFAYTSAATYIMVDVLDRPAADYGLWFLLLAAFVMAGLASAERLSGRVRSGLLAWVGSLLVMLGCMLLAWVLLDETTPLSPLRLFLPATMAGFGVGLALPGTNAGVMEIVPSLAGTASGLLGFLQFGTAAVFAQVVVQDEPHTAAVLAWLVLVAGVGAAGFGVLSLRHGFGERTRPTVSEPPTPST